MLILDVLSTCNSPALAAFLSIFKRIMLLIQIIVPILLIVFAGIDLFKLMSNPDDKKGPKTIVNKFIAAAIVFFIPVFVNAVMGLVGESTNFSSCWNNASETYTPGSNNYSCPYDDCEKETIIPKKSDYGYNFDFPIQRNINC